MSIHHSGLHGVERAGHLADVVLRVVVAAADRASPHQKRQRRLRDGERRGEHGADVERLQGRGCAPPHALGDRRARERVAAVERRESPQIRRGGRRVPREEPSLVVELGDGRLARGDELRDRRRAANRAAGERDGDVAARGLDIPNVEVVLNFTFPLTIEDYVHRIGRTGRAGKSGTSHTFFQPTDKSHAGELQQVMKQADQPVPEELMKFGSTIKKKEHKLYGNFGPRGGPMKKATKITFGDDD